MPGRVLKLFKVIVSKVLKITHNLRLFKIKLNKLKYPNSTKNSKQKKKKKKKHIIILDIPCTQPMAHFVRTYAIMIPPES